MIGTHVVELHTDPSDDPSGPVVDISCLVDAVAITHGRSDTQAQPDAAAATLDLTVSPVAPLPGGAEIGAWLLITTTVSGTPHTRFRGRITDVSIGWDDAGEDTPDEGVCQLVAVGVLADYARRLIGDEPWPQELDGARVARVFELAGVPLNPATSDPGKFQITPRDVDRRDALDIARGAADSAGGLVWHTRAGEIRYADADHRRGHAVDVDLDACDVLVTPTWQRNLTGLVNEATLTYGVAPEGGSPPSVTAVNEPSQARYGRYEMSSTVELADSTDALFAAAEIVGMNGTPVWMLSNMPVDVAALDVATTNALLELELHDAIRVGGLPATGTTPTSVVAWVEGWTETLAWGVHDLEFVVSDFCRTNPPPRWNDIPAVDTWNTFDPKRTWDSMHCYGPLPDQGKWDQVAATTRWNMVDPAARWDDVGGGVPVAS